MMGFVTAVEPPSSYSQVIQIPLPLHYSGALFFLLGAIAVLIILLVFVLVFGKRIKPTATKKTNNPIKTNNGSMEFFSGSLGEIGYFDFQTLKKATMDFHPGNLLGSGGFGPVYLAWKLYQKSCLLDLVDPKLRAHGFVEKDVLQAIHVALLCLQPHGKLRPPMSDIVALLTFKIEMIVFWLHFSSLPVLVMTYERFHNTRIEAVNHSLFIKGSVVVKARQVVGAAAATTTTLVSIKVICCLQCLPGNCNNIVGPKTSQEQKAQQKCELR
ncbi:putative LRR receptor-like serine/threonine-protein kinase [Senna tora]|uniref:Putative LRR receptor-like serine/threonine-protein kinase n=1 Tax=Senna tora TaxID=362788 RepID=A0A834X3P9_9FABA|nr:putative LRR receptor-like serine/threonine-protein kinase [Senna tora]